MEKIRIGIRDKHPGSATLLLGGRIEDPDMIIYPLLKSALLTVESGVVARVLEPGSGEAPAQQTQVNLIHKKVPWWDSNSTSEKKMSAERRKKN